MFPGGEQLLDSGAAGVFCELCKIPALVMTPTLFSADGGLLNPAGISLMTFGNGSIARTTPPKATLSSVWGPLPEGERFRGFAAVAPPLVRTNATEHLFIRAGKSIANMAWA